MKRLMSFALSLAFLAIPTSPVPRGGRGAWRPRVPRASSIAALPFFWLNDGPVDVGLISLGRSSESVGRVG
jgi:hypothetical protein